MASLSDSQREFYENVRKVTREEIKEINGQIQQEIAAIREKIKKLNREIQAVRSMYDSACVRLGVEPDSDHFISSLKLDEVAGTTGKVAAEEVEAEEITIGDELLEAAADEGEEEIEY